MSEAVIPHAEPRGAVHHEVGFIRQYIFSTDHKMIGKQFLTLGLFGLLMGGVLAMLVRWELAFPETPVPGLGWVPEPTMFGGVIPPDTYNAFFTMHATIMIFFAVMPIMVGCFGNFLIPLMIGARDMAFPLLNMLSFWVGACSAVIMFASFFVPGGAAAGGWTSYAPLSAVPSYTGVIWGQHLWCISLIILGISSLMGSINYITTIINMRAPGMTWFRLPLVIWSLFITAILLLLSLPVLTSALGMLLFDRMAEEPEEMLPEERLAAALGQEEVRAGHAVEQQHPERRSEHRQGEQQEDGGDEERPDDERQAEPGHPRRPHVDDGRDVVD